MKKLAIFMMAMAILMPLNAKDFVNCGEQISFKEINFKTIEHIKIPERPVPNKSIVADSRSTLNAVYLALIKEKQRAIMSTIALKQKFARKDSVFFSGWSLYMEPQAGMNTCLSWIRERMTGSQDIIEISNQLFYVLWKNSVFISFVGKETGFTPSQSDFAGKVRKKDFEKWIGNLRRLYDNSDSKGKKAIIKDIDKLIWPEFEQIKVRTELR